MTEKPLIQSALLPLHGTQEIRDVPLDKLKAAPFQSRDSASEEAKEANKELRESLLEHGQLEPIIVRAPLASGDKYEVLAGNRRVAVARYLKWAIIRATIVTADCADQAAYQIGMLDNMKRRNLTPLEEARQLAYGRDTLELDIAPLAEMMKRSERWIKERLDLLTLHPDIQSALASGEVSIGEAQALKPAAEMGGKVLDAALSCVGIESDTPVAQIVRRVIQEFTVALGKQTPFDYKELCKKAGCLAEGPNGPVCTDPKMWFESCLESALPEMEEVLGSMLKGNRDGIDAGTRRLEADGMSVPLPVYWNLDELQPNGGAIRVRGKPTPPLTLIRYRGERDPKDGAWPMRLLGKEVSDTCLDCPAYSAKARGKPSRAIVVTAASRHMMGEKATAEIVCMGGACRAQKLTAGQTDVEKRNTKRERERAAASRIAGEVALGGAALLAKKRTRALAVALVSRRQSRTAALEMDYEVRDLMKLLKLKLPLGATIIDQLAALGEPDLIRLIALRFVAGMDGAKTYEGWKPKAVDATLGLVLSENQVADLQAKAQPGTEPTRVRGKLAAAKPKAKRAAKKRSAKAKA